MLEAQANTTKPMPFSLIDMIKQRSIYFSPYKLYSELLLTYRGIQWKCGGRQQKKLLVRYM